LKLEDRIKIIREIGCPQKASPIGAAILDNLGIAVRLLPGKRPLAVFLRINRNNIIR
jgi:hypothetical protein